MSSRVLAPTTPGAMLSPGGVVFTGTEALVLQQIDNKLFFVNDEVPSGAVNGANTVFTTANTVNPTSSIEVFVNGNKMKGGGIDFTFSSTNTITFVTAPPTTSNILVNYLRYP